MNKHPLVSIPVITYNSSAYIIEGLESIKAQTYENIELVISDDCSTDNTVEICQKWLEDNKQFFKRAVLITADKNTGVAGNLNRAIRECEGEWIKPLSGDDKFFPYTIEKYIDYIIVNPTVNICFAKMHLFGEKNVISRIQEKYEKLFEEIRNPHNQFIRYLDHHYIPGPGLMFKKSVWEKVGGFNEQYPFCEELSFNLSVLKNGETIYYIDQELYEYNVRSNSISNAENINYRNFIDAMHFFKDIKIKEMIKHGLILKAYDEYITYHITYEKNFDTKSKLKLLVAYILRLTSPVFYLSKLKKVLPK